ncbi:MAG: DUF2399 domain-containing protein [Lapillicoccus sp.]
MRPRSPDDVAPPTGTDPPFWWADEQLKRIWGLIGDRLERAGLRPEGLVRVDGLSRPERHAISDLLGRPVTAPHVVVDLAELDERLLLRSGTRLVEAAEQVSLRTLVDRGAERAARRTLVDQTNETAARWVAAHDELDWLWWPAWLEGMRRDGFLSRSADPSALVLQSLTVLFDRRDALAGDASAVPVARTELAARTADDAHALDPDRRLSTAVLRALATRAGAQPPTDAASRRELWEAAGVLVDSVSATCLVWNVLADTFEAISTRGGGHRQDRDPRHLTWWDLRRGFAPQGGQWLLVCENPRVLEAVAQLDPDGVGVVCTMGRPNLVTQELLTRAREAGCVLAYHGDFDWPGVAMANVAQSRFGASVWLMSASDYQGAPASLGLRGETVEPQWDPELGAAMRGRGLAVHEEAVLPRILEALGRAR